MPHPAARPGKIGRKELIALCILGAAGLGIALPLIVFRGPGNKTVCRARLETLGKGLLSYAAEHKGNYPVVSHAPAVNPGRGSVTYAPGRIGRYRDSAPPAQATDVSTTANLHLLIRTGRAKPADFICPSSEDVADQVAQAQDKWDFARYSSVSYGYQVPFGSAGRPDTKSDPTVAVVADKGPYGAALEGGKPNPGPPTADRKGEKKPWRAWNNANHKKDNNVLYADGHVEKRATPLAGFNKDNIYTRWSDLAKVRAYDPLAWAHGTPPTGTETPLGDTDSLIYP